MRGPTEIAPGVFGMGTEIVNWYLVEEGGRLTAIDAGLPGFARTLEADLARLGHGLDAIDAVVLTHSDTDHTGIAATLRARGARVLVHADDQATLRKPGPKGGDASLRAVLPNLLTPLVRAVLKDTLRHGGLRPAKVADAETFADGDVLDVPGRPRVVHTPGHTPGHCVLLLEERGVLLAGDALITHPLVTHGEGPRLMPSFVNTSTAQARASLDRIEALDAGLVVFGHGDPWPHGAAEAARQARAAATRGSS